MDATEYRKEAIATAARLGEMSESEILQAIAARPYLLDRLLAGYAEPNCYPAEDIGLMLAEEVACS